MAIFENNDELNYYRYITKGMDHDFDTEDGGIYSLSTAKHHGMKFYDDGYSMILNLQPKITFKISEDGTYDLSEIPGQFLYWLPPWGIRNIEKLMVQTELLLNHKISISCDPEVEKTDLTLLMEKLTYLDNRRYAEFDAPGINLPFLSRGSDIQTLKWKLFETFNIDPSLLILEMTHEELMAVYQ